MSTHLKRPNVTCSTFSAVATFGTQPRAAHRLTVASETPSISAARRWLPAHVQKSLKLSMPASLHILQALASPNLALCVMERLARQNGTRKDGRPH